MRDGIRYWFDKRGGLAMPARADIDPAEMKTLLPHIMLFDVQQEPRDFRYRLIGTEVRHHLARDLTGQWMSGIEFQRPPSEVWSNFERAIAAGVPLVGHPPYVGPHRDYLHIEDAVCPLGTAEDGVTMLMIFADFLKG